MDGMIAWIDKQGDSLRMRFYGDSGYDDLLTILPVADGYIATGLTTSSAIGPYDGWLLKIDWEGNELWSRYYRGPGSDRYVESCLAPNGDILVGGFTDANSAGGLDFLLVRYNQRGDSLWSRTYGGPSQDMLFGMVQVDDSAYVLCGHSFSFGNGSADAWLLKTNSDGDSLWSFLVGGPENDEVWLLAPTRDLGYVMTGYTSSFTNGNMDFFIVKTTPDTSKPGSALEASQNLSVENTKHE